MNDFSPLVEVTTTEFFHGRISHVCRAARLFEDYSTHCRSGRYVGKHLIYVNDKIFLMDVQDQTIFSYNYTQLRYNRRINYPTRHDFVASKMTIHSIAVLVENSFCAGGTDEPSSVTPLESMSLAITPNEINSDETLLCVLYSPSVVVWILFNVFVMFAMEQLRELSRSC